MAHPQQVNFCLRIKHRWPHLFENKRVLDCGSLDINGNNRYLFSGGSYIGIDLFAGPNVDTVSLIHEYSGEFDVVISTECFEHDANFDKTFQRMIEMLSPTGLLLFTCATKGRPEHGTIGHEEYASPGTNNYYRNIDPAEVVPFLSSSFRCWGIEIEHSDLYGWALDPIKKADTISSIGH